MVLTQRFRFVFCLISLSFFSWSGFTQEKSYETSAKNYSFQGISFGTTYAQLKTKFPTIVDETNPDDQSLGRSIYSLQNIPNTSAVFFYSYKDSIYAIRIVYDVETTNRLGGWTTITEKVIEKYGKADPASKGYNTNEKNTIANFFWYFANVKRSIYLVVLNDFMYVEFTDTGKYEKMQDDIKNTVDLNL